MLLKRDYPPDKRRQFLEIVHAESTRLARLVSDFLDIQRLEAGQVEYHRTHLSLGPLAEEMAEVFGAQQHEIHLEVADPLPDVEADPDRIRQVIANLLSNAIKFSVDPGSIEVRIDHAEGKVRLAVTDHGIGILEADQDKLFDKFFRTEDARHRAISGSGLGLALVRQIVEAHGGTISVDSVPGTQTTFTISLPVAQAT